VDELVALENENVGGRDRRLMLLVSAFAGLVVCTQVGSIIAPSLVKHNPALVLALSSRIRHLLFAVPAGINPVAYAVIGFLRISAAAWLCYAIGYWYGDRGFRWLERQAGGEPPATLRWLQKAAQSAGGPLVVFMPGSNIVCALVGQRRMPMRRFAMWLSLGLAFRLAWVWVAARTFDTQLKKALDWIEKYQWWLVAAFFLVSVVQSARRASAPPPPPMPEP
jgi:membrane protein DedA with SNARE-associated domain